VIGYGRRRTKEEVIQLACRHPMAAF
jgi:hypothetical protein